MVVARWFFELFLGLNGLMYKTEIMTIYIPDDCLRDDLTAENIKLELAILLFQQEQLTLAQAARLVGWHRTQLQRELAKRKISLHYGIEELKEDMKTLNLL